jgi:hypothetical protein
MHSLLILTVLLLANLSFVDWLIQSPTTPDCPTVSVTCPEEVESGKPLKFKAKVEGGKPKWEPTFNWTVDKGTIKSGQGTATIEVDLEGQDCKGVTATVEVSGVDPSCPRVASCTACIADGAGDKKIKLNDLLGLVRTASAEVRADALLAIASSNLVTDAKSKADLVAEAFRIAEDVREPVKRRSFGLQVDTRAGYKAMAFDMGLDKLSIQSRAGLKMISLDTFQARTMFEQIGLPRNKRLSCEDSLVADVDLYYETMFAVAERTFGKEEQKNRTHVQFLAERLERIQSVAELTAAVKMMVSAKLPPADLLWLARVITEALDRISSDPRSFTYSIDRDPFVSNLHRLILKMKEHGLPANDLANATRRLLVKNLSGEVCRDASWLQKSPPVLPLNINRINSELGIPITIDEIRPARLGSKSSDVLYWSTATSKSVLEATKALRFGGGTEQLSLEKRNTEEWNDKLREFLKLLDSWDPSSEASEDDYFQQKCNAYRVLVDLCPDDVQRDSVLRSYSAYLRDSDSKYKGRIEWIMAFKEYLRALQWKSEQLRNSSLQPWLSGSNTNLRVYAELTLMTGSKN